MGEVWRLLVDTNRCSGSRGLSEACSASALESITAGAGAELDHLTYDTAGRVQSWANATSMVEYLDFDLAGHPNKTRQTRYKDGTGLTSKQILDSFEQVYGWNVHGERISWTIPQPATFSPIAGWTEPVFEDHDAAGNITSITRTLSGSTTATSLMAASFRNAGRPTQRTVTTNCVGLMACAPKTIERGYGYDASTSQLNEMVAKVGATTVAGSHAGFDGLQINDIQLLGVSGDTRHPRYT
jgi:hypothetical protein